MSHSHVDGRAGPSIFASHPVPTAIALACVSLLPHFFLPEDLSIGFAAMLISLIAGIYFGFAVVNGATREQMIEFNVAGLFLLAALVGFAVWPGIIALAYVSHAVWDVAHHNRLHLSLVRIPAWYVPWCAIIDVVVGIGLFVIWRFHGVI